MRPEDGTDRKRKRMIETGPPIEVAPESPFAEVERDFGRGRANKRGLTGFPILKRKENKNCSGSFQVLWNKNCTTENEEIMMEKLI